MLFDCFLYSTFMLKWIISPQIYVTNLSSSHVSNHVKSINQTSIQSYSVNLTQQQPTNCLSVFDHFVGLALKRISEERLWFSILKYIAHRKFDLVVYPPQSVYSSTFWGILTQFLSLRFSQEISTLAALLKLYFLIVMFF